MEIQINSPITAKHPEIKKQFDEWWYFNNSIGIFSFILFLACLGTTENRYFCSLLSVCLITWLLYYGKKKYPKFITNLRKLGPEYKEFEKTINKEQLSLTKLPFTYFGFWLGTFSLFGLFIYPLTLQLNIIKTITLYLPSF